jgi:Type VI secretion system, TssF
MKGNTKEQIKNRMIKKAATLWGVAVNEIEMSFDPIVALLIAACASEIEKISSEVDESQTRVTEKLMQLMTPETANGATPAHAILYAESDDDITLLKTEYLFQYKKEISYDKTEIRYKDLFFSPVQEFNLVNAKIEYLATGNTIMTLEDKKNWRHLYQDNNSQLPSSTMYIGVSSDLKEIPVKDISLYFELQAVENKELFYHHLRNVEWYIDGDQIEVVDGFYNSNDSHLSNLEHIFEDTSDKTNQLSKKVINAYQKHYITLKSLVKGKGIVNSKFVELQEIINSNKVKIGNDIRWIKIVFPGIISNKTLEKLHCSFNAFPAINRELNSFTYQIREYINILPIKTDDLFFDMKSITNTDGDIYRERSKNSSNEDKGTFVLRGDNMGKLDKRQAREYLIHLIELLKDESASFSFMNNDFLQTNLKGLNQLLALLEKKVTESSNEMTQTNYIVLKPYKTNENLLVEYWITNGDIANGISPGSPLVIYKGFGVGRNNCYLVTTTHGGKDDLNMKERLNSYRRSLLSRDRVVTKEDVKALCDELYGDRIEKVEIKNGYTDGVGLNKGMVQCVEILLSPNHKNNTEIEEWETIGNNLSYYLEKNSINVFPYKINILH